MIRVACYIDGFNLYHALDDMSRATGGRDNYLKWVCLKSLMHVFTDPKAHTIVSVKYFSAYATWKPDAYARHQVYVKALENTGVEVILGRFKEKDVYCKNCRRTFKGHEEKESDVNIATNLISDAYQDVYDLAFIVSRDSDLAGPIRMMRKVFPQKRIKVVAPPQRRHSKELWALAHSRADIKRDHVLACLLPAEIRDTASAVICARPPGYAPP